MVIVMRRLELRVVSEPSLDVRAVRFQRLVVGALCQLYRG